MRVTPELEATEIFSVSGETKTLGSLWAEQPTIVVWLRHYG